MTTWWSWLIFILALVIIQDFRDTLGGIQRDLSAIRDSLKRLEDRQP